ncbi:MAG: hypothetical protein LBP59_06795 [Planctomycetaceae bacterium]|jgi:CheY-like chemotaxis protein|nr:hypothetical protein [Planctomycetaceae bacterium]
MYLEYKILWIDDDLKSYIDNGDVASVKDFLLEKGFEPIIETVFDVSDVTKLAESISMHDYDLILSDYKLGDKTGDNIIKRIREVDKKDSEILFYTAKTDYKKEPKVKDNLAFIDRLTFHFGRDSLMDRIEKVISLTLKKLLDINATRGLIMAVTSELDVEIINIYNAIISELLSNDESKSKVDKIFKEDYKGVKKKHIKDCIKKRDSLLPEKYKIYFDSSDAFRKYNILKELLKMKGLTEFDVDLFKEYKKEVIDIRNKFAHAQSDIQNDKTILKGHLEDEDFEFNEIKCTEIRKTLIKHKQNIDKLKNILQKEKNDEQTN